MWASTAMIPDPRARQPRDGPMQCGNQSADISVIHRRYKLRASRSPSGADPQPNTHLVRKIASIILAPVDTKGPYQLIEPSRSRLFGLTHCVSRQELAFQGVGRQSPIDLEWLM